MSKANIKQEQYEAITKAHKFVNFKGSTFLKTPDRFIPLLTTHFATLAYQIFPFASIAQIREVEHLIRHHAEDVTHTASHLIRLSETHVWNTRTLRLSASTAQTVLATTHPPNDDDTNTEAVWAYLTTLAGGSRTLANDYLQALAPLFMDKKPTGIIWFIGDGANGKSALLSTIYRLLGPHLASLTVADIEDGRDTPSLNGCLGNICLESSEGRVENTERYKTLGTHEDFTVHRFHSQETTTIHGNIHTVFNANTIPSFSDKTLAARRRTLTIPFPATFRDDPTFEERTFTEPFLGSLLHLLLETTKALKANHYRYKWGGESKTAKQEYDADVNSAEAYLAHLRAEKVRGFNNYRLLRIAYENWCANHGHIALGVMKFKSTLTKQARAESRPIRFGEDVRRIYVLDDHQDWKTNITMLENGMWIEPGGNIIGAKTPEQTQLGDEW